MISVIVPVYNVADYLPRCLDSILNQTYKDLEIILVDDGSTDGCSDICDKYKIKDNRIRVIHKENGGLSSARNAGLDVAKGDYISFIDSDDYIDEVMYESMTKALQNNEADLCICSYDRVNEKKEHFGAITYKDAVMSQNEAYEMLVQDNVYFVIMCSKLYKRTIFKSLRFLEGKIHEDEQLIHYIYGECSKIVTLSNVFYHYYNRSSSIMGTIKYNIKSIDGLYAYIDRIYYFYKESKGEYASRMILVSLLCFYDLKSNLDIKNQEIKVLLKEKKSELCNIIKKTKKITGLNKYDRLTLKLFTVNTGLCQAWIALLNLLRR